jgi:hypothetical protein
MGSVPLQFKFPISNFKFPHSIFLYSLLPSLRAFLLSCFPASLQPVWSCGHHKEGQAVMAASAWVVVMSLLEP